MRPTHSSTGAPGMVCEVTSLPAERHPTVAYLFASWSIATCPGIAIFPAVTASNLLGGGLRDALDPPLRRHGDRAPGRRKRPRPGRNRQEFSDLLPMGFARSYHRWHSPTLRRDMELLVFGHAGARVLAFPTSQGRFFDWEDRGLIGALAEHLSHGWVQVFCVDSVDGESWFGKHLPPADRARRHVEYDHYVLDEVLPFSMERNASDSLILTGASFGAYHAVNFAFRYPRLARRVIGLSGFYDIRRWTNGYNDDNVYFNNPCEFLIHEHDPERLAELRRLDIILTIGETDTALANNRYLSEVLWSQGIWHALRVWDGFAHDWPVWQDMLRRYIGGHD